jgi:hypothetical protein
MDAGGTRLFAARDTAAAWSAPPPLTDSRDDARPAGAFTSMRRYADNAAKAVVYRAVAAVHVKLRATVNDRQRARFACAQPPGDTWEYFTPEPPPPRADPPSAWLQPYGLHFANRKARACSEERSASLKRASA